LRHFRNERVKIICRNKLLVIAFLRLYVFNSIQCGTVGAWMRTVDATAQKAPVHCYTAVDVRGKYDLES